MPVSLLDDVLDAPATPARPHAWRRALRMATPLLLVVVVVAAGFGADRPVVSDTPTSAQADAAYEEPCRLLPRPELASLIGQPLGRADTNGGVGFTQCLYTGLPGRAQTVVDLQVASAASLSAAGIAESPVEALEDIRAGADLGTEPVALEGLGDEAWIIDTNQQTVWARQGALLLGVSVVSAADPTDVGRAEAVARLLVGGIAAQQGS